jgi:hypothetical protein
MSNLQSILKSAEESVKVVEDPELRKIAFHEILRRLLGSENEAPREPRQGSSATARRAKARSSPAPKANGQPAIRSEVANLDLSPDEPSLASWGTLTADWKKFCWILEAARLKKVDGLTNSEISHLIEKVFRENYRAEVVNNLKVQIKKGMVKSIIIKSGDRKYRVWKILNGGMQEVKAKAVAIE